MLGLASCGKKESVEIVKTLPTIQNQTGSETPSKDPLVLARRMDRTDAARCGVIFATIADTAKQTGSPEQLKQALLYKQATQYLTALQLADRNDPPQRYLDIQTAVGREAKAWTDDQRNANFGYCVNQFQKLYSALDEAGKIDKSPLDSGKDSKARPTN